jgi:hypothetical protein
LHFICTLAALGSAERLFGVYKATAACREGRAGSALLRELRTRTANGLAIWLRL